MTVATTIAKMPPYAGTGIQVDFPFTFKVMTDTDLVVILTDAAGVETVQTLTTHYTAALTPAPGVGGTVTMLTPPAAGEILTILREIPYTQEIDYTENGPFLAETHEEGLDRAVMLAQQLKEVLSRCPQLAKNSALSDLILPEPEDGKVLMGNPTGDGYLNAALAAAALIAMTGMDTAGFVKNSAAGVLRGGQSIVPSDLPAAAEEAQGAVELATAAETITGTDTARATTPAGVKAAMDTAKADQADQETGTATEKYVAPATQQFHLSAAKAWAKVAADGSLTAGYNVASSAKDSTGIYSVVFTTPFSSANYAVLVTPGGSAVPEVRRFPEVNHQLADRFKVDFIDIVGYLADPEGFFIVCFGDQ